jgi:hypothetical protein
LLILLLVLVRSSSNAGDRFLPPQRQKLRTSIDPTFDVEGRELADQIIQDPSSFAQLRIRVNGMTYAQKIAVAQIACNQMAGSPSNQLIQLKPIGGEFDDQLKLAFVWLGSLSLETLAQLAIEILEECTAPNE